MKRNLRKLKIFNSYICTQIRIDPDLKRSIRIICATKEIDTRKEFCERSFKYFLANKDYHLIAPIKNGSLFRVEMSNIYNEHLDGEVQRRNSNISRIFHTALYSYVENFKLNNPELSKQLIAVNII